MTDNANGAAREAWFEVGDQIIPDLAMLAEYVGSYHDDPCIAHAGTRIGEKVGRLSDLMDEFKSVLPKEAFEPPDPEVIEKMQHRIMDAVGKSLRCLEVREIDDALENLDADGLRELDRAARLADSLLYSLREFVDLSDDELISVRPPITQ